MTEVRRFGRLCCLYVLLWHACHLKLCILVEISRAVLEEPGDVLVRHLQSLAQGRCPGKGGARAGRQAPGERRQTYAGLVHCRRGALYYFLLA